MKHAPAAQTDLELLTVAELRAKLKISSTTYYRLLGAGHLPHRLLGTSRRFVWTEVVAALPKGPMPVRAVEPYRRPLDMVAILKERARNWTSKGAS